ncbi:sigma-70 family RNA polymerase sigma factor [Pseudoalteromonas viridis]|uniref:Sigma-70 family RNA polymerase sigma factor n=1 Tax=Pseudoalteromonas viridis TaxID=339617 RepID=A0ABX7V1T0_9GAMM|nr:sigma-70 family RNA polymerase sigma factor [Pseudoalteromonas viridis]QTL34764.1 sigma-70 family RNA polymerase sigma factor [Pseudoalteromonas viridis]
MIEKSRQQSIETPQGSVMKDVAATQTSEQRLLSPEQQAQLCDWMHRIAKQRDRKAFACLFKWFAPKVLHLGRQRFGDASQAQELLQESMANVWRKAHLFNAEKGAVTTWIYTLVRNQSFDMLRKMQTNREDNLSEDIWQQHSNERDDSAEFSDHLLDRQLVEYVEKLPEEQKNVVKGIYFQEMSQEELANQLGIPLGTVKSRLRLALGKLKAHMGEHHD